MISSDDPKYNVPGLDRALSIIELLNRQPEGLSVNEISNQLKYPINSVYRIMMTLERRNFVRKQSRGSVFVLSEKFLTLSTPVAGEPAFIETALPFMRDLRDDTQETVLAGVLVGNEGVVLEQCEDCIHLASEYPLAYVFLSIQQHPVKFFLLILNQRKDQK